LPKDAAVQRDVILVTGGAGFIGANFVLDWLRRQKPASR
jgi:dTDP-D-glucose 4,6-dehydratase